VPFWGILMARLDYSLCAGIQNAFSVVYKVMQICSDTAIQSLQSATDIITYKTYGLDEINKGLSRLNSGYFLIQAEASRAPSWSGAGLS
jgi:hypothetical protein